MERLSETTIWRRVRRFIKRGKETAKIDFKAKLELSNARGKSEFVKDVTAIANTPGGEGFLIVGVAEQADTVQVTGFSPAEGVDVLERQMISILANYSDPLPEVEYYQLQLPFSEFPEGTLRQTVGEAHVPLGIVRIKPTRRPHKIIRDSETIRKDEVYVRRGSATFRASPEEIIAMSEAEVVSGMVVINLSSHPLTEEQRNQLQRLERAYIVEEIDVPVHVDPMNPIEHQIEALIEEIDFCIEEWSGTPLYIVLPGLSPFAAAVLAYMHGLRGGFPKAVWIYQSPSDPSCYEIAQIINLQQLRDNARRMRTEVIKER